MADCFPIAAAICVCAYRQSPRVEIVMSAVWRYTIREMVELPSEDLYFDGIGAFEVIGENVRLIPYKLVPGTVGQPDKLVTLERAFVRPLVGWLESLEHAHAMLAQMPVPKPDFIVKGVVGH